MTKGRKSTFNIGDNKTLQSELQALIAFACYESDHMIGSGHDMTHQDQKEKMYNMYMPDPDKKDHISYVEQFLQGEGCFKYLFEKDEGELVIPRHFHRSDYRISITEGCVDEDFLKMKNIKSLHNNQPIKADRLYRHTKDVAANFHKAMALVLSSECPYKDKTYPSGKNWIDYIEWVNEEMNSKYPRQGDALFFTGFFAFCLWGHIPPEGGEKYESALTKMIEPTSDHHNIYDGRAAVKSKDIRNNTLRSEKAKIPSSQTKDSIIVH